MRLPLLLAQQAPGGSDLIWTFLPLVAIGAIFYFLIIRPQRQREEARQEMISEVKKGDDIVTIGGVHGSVVKVDGESVLADVGSGTRIRFDKEAIASIGGKKPTES